MNIELVDLTVRDLVAGCHGDGDGKAPDITICQRVRNCVNY